jgi:hypothetical protein
MLFFVILDPVLTQPRRADITSLGGDTRIEVRDITVRFVLNNVTHLRESRF